MQETNLDLNKKPFNSLSLFCTGLAALIALTTSKRKLWTTPIMAGIGFIVGKLLEFFLNKTDKK